MPDHEDHSHPDVVDLAEGLTSMSLAQTPGEPNAVTPSPGAEPGKNLNANTPIVNLPQEILLVIATELPTAIDIFVLRSTCKSLYNRLGQGNRRLWYTILYRRKSKKQRKPKFDPTANYFQTVKDFLAGVDEEEGGCQLCLKCLTDSSNIRYFYAYRGGLFYKKVCLPCGRAHFKPTFEVESEYPKLKLDPNLTIEWFGTAPFHFPTPAESYSYYNNNWQPTSIRLVDFQWALKDQAADDDPSSLTLSGAALFTLDRDNEITDIINRKKAADTVIPLLVSEYSQPIYRCLHRLKPIDQFGAYLYDVLTWEKKPWLSTNAEVKGLPLFTLGESLRTLLQEYTDATTAGLPEPLALKNIKIDCHELIKKEFAKFPAPAQKFNKLSGTLSPLIRHWMEAWIRERNYKGAPFIRYRNERRACGFCESQKGEEQVAFYFNSTVVLAVHVWVNHPAKMEEEWAWLPVADSY